MCIQLFPTPSEGGLEPGIPSGQAWTELAVPVLWGLCQGGWMGRVLLQKGCLHCCVARPAPTKKQCFPNTVNKPLPWRTGLWRTQAEVLKATTTNGKEVIFQGTENHSLTSNDRRWWNKSLHCFVNQGKKVMAGGSSTTTKCDLYTKPLPSSSADTAYN